jgi:hypothetical protein
MVGDGRYTRHAQEGHYRIVLGTIHTMEWEYSDIVSISSNALDFGRKMKNETDARYSYYLNDLLKLIGYTNADIKNKLNVGLNSWNLINAVFIALLVRRFPRRVMYM